MLCDEEGLFKATWGLWYNTITGRRLDRARDHAEALVTLAAKINSGDLMLEGLHRRWSTAMFRGDTSTALTNGHEGIERYNREKHSWMGPVFGGHDPGVCAYAVHAITLGLGGHQTEAGRRIEQSIALAEQLRHPNSMAHALVNGLVSAQLRDDYRAVRQYSERLIGLAEKYHLPPPRAHAVFLSGWERAVATDLDAGMAVMEAEYPRASAMGPFFRYYAALLAEVREKAGRYSEALVVLRSALDTVTEPGVGLYVSELYRLQGICLLHADRANEEEAVASLRSAVAIAGQQRATLLQLRAALSLAHAMVAVGRPAEGLDPLREVCSVLPEDLNNANVAEARQFLST